MQPPMWPNELSNPCAERRGVGGRAQVPLADVRGRVAHRAEHLGDRDFPPRHALRADVGGHPGTERVAAGEQGRARRRAHGSGGVELTESNPAPGERIEVGCFDVGSPGGTEVGRSLIVGHDDDHVRTVGRECRRNHHCIHKIWSDQNAK